MNSYSIKREHIIFAIISHPVSGDDPLVFVGKTTQKNLKRVLHYHKKNNHYASAVFEEGVDATIYHLETVHCTAPDAYRHVLAFMRYFIDHNFDVISHHAPYEAALDLHERAQDIYNVIFTIPLPEILSRNTTPTESTKTATQESPKKSPLTSRLSIRVTESEYNRFTSFCHELGLTQRDAILSLFGKEASLESLALQRISQQAHIIASLKNQVQNLIHIVENGSRGANADKKLIEALSLCSIGIHQYLRLVLDCNNTTEHLRCLSWNQFTQTCPNWKEYSYPQHSDPIYLHVQFMCYGKGSRPCIFLYGFDRFTGEKLRFRFYPKRTYIGPTPNHSHSIYEGVCMLIMAKQDGEGVADMVLALPLPKDYAVDTFPESQSSLEDILHSAAKRSQA